MPILSPWAPRWWKSAAAAIPGKDHCDPGVLLHDEAKFNEFVKTIEESGLEISALSCHGNPVHPNKEIAKQFDDDMHDAVLMAEKLGIHQINCFSGCPGRLPPSPRTPTGWSAPGPTSFARWWIGSGRKFSSPIWKDFVAFAKAHGVNKIALEMHQGFCVYNTYTLKKLREGRWPRNRRQPGSPAHLIWQGMDPIQVIPRPGRRRQSSTSIAKDTKIDPINAPIGRHLGLPPLRRRNPPLLDFSAPSATATTSCSGRSFVSQLRLGGLRLCPVHRA